jgi:hypothetical protein
MVTDITAPRRARQRDRAHRVEFTAEEGANLHCQPLGRAITDERMFAWLGGQLGGAQPLGRSEGGQT